MRNKILQTRVSEQELTEIEFGAEELGIPLASYIRSISLQHAREIIRQKGEILE